MKTKSVIEREITFSSNEYSDSPSRVRLEFTGDDLHRIATCQCLIKDNKKHGILSMRITAPDYELFTDEYFDDDSDEDEEGVDVTEKISEWCEDRGELIVYEDSVYFYAQNSDDASDQIESDGITFDAIMAGFADDQVETI